MTFITHPFISLIIIIIWLKAIDQIYYKNKLDYLMNYFVPFQIKSAYSWHCDCSCALYCCIKSIKKRLSRLSKACWKVYLYSQSFNIVNLKQNMVNLLLATQIPILSTGTVFICGGQKSFEETSYGKVRNHGILDQCKSKHFMKYVLC